MGRKTQYVTHWTSPPDGLIGVQPVRYTDSIGPWGGPETVRGADPKKNKEKEQEKEKSQTSFVGNSESGSGPINSEYWDSLPELEEAGEV